MLIFTQFQTTSCLRIEMSSVWKLRSERQVAFHFTERNQKIRFLLIWFRNIVIFLDTTIVHAPSFLCMAIATSYLIWIIRSFRIRWETISKPIQIQNNSNIRPVWTPKSGSCTPLISSDNDHHIPLLNAIIWKEASNQAVAPSITRPLHATATVCFHQIQS